MRRIPKHFRRLLGALLFPPAVLVTSLAWAASPEVLDEAARARVDACVEAALQALDIPGAQVAVVKDGEIVYERGYGVRSRDTGEPVDAETVFRAGSVQKMMTAAAVLAQRDRGLLDLDEPVVRWIPELRFAGRHRVDRIEVRHLLTHSAAIPDGGELQCGTDDGTLSAWAASLGDTHLYAPAGSFYNYSNPGFALAGLVAERAAGMPYREVIRRFVWEPAAMSHTFFTGAEALATGNYSTGHAIDELTGQPVLFAPGEYDCWALAPSGTAFTTAADLARFAAVLMQDGAAVLTPESARALQETQISTLLPPQVGYGFCVATETWAGERVRSHDGGIAGWTSHLVWAPDHGVAVAVVGNSDGNVSPAAECAFSEVTSLARDPWGDLSTDPRTWHKYEGVYAVRLGTGELVPASVRHRRGVRHLSVTTVDPATGEVASYDAPQLFLDTFFVDLDRNGEPDGSEIVTFIPGQGGSASSVRWMRNRFYVGEWLGRPRFPNAVFRHFR